ncbi:MAG: hypothetical protein GY749_44705 [Desulfobacteraceae bacterium]|nr:hypothetical protein [Desulfobacteraceae bacterium]
MAIPSMQELRKRFSQISGLMHLDDGGQKLVLAGFHPEYGDVVLKLTSKVDDRTRREIDIVTTNKFPGVPVLYDWGTESFENGEIWYLVEERVKGYNLRSVLEQTGPLDFQQSIRVLGLE